MAHVLIVDDDQGIRESLRMALEEEGHTVAEASDGITALGLLRAGRERYVVLLDQLMPELDGLGVLNTIREEPTLARAHAYILLTASSRLSVPAVEYASTPLSVPVVRKPFDLHVLLDLIAESAQRLDAGE